MPSQPTTGHITKCFLTKRKCGRGKYGRNEVLRILAIASMDQQPPKKPDEPPVPADLHADFYTTSRVGRRNAMPDILGHHCTTTTANLSEKLSELSTRDYVDLLANTNLVDLKATANRSADGAANGKNGTTQPAQVNDGQQPSTSYSNVSC